MKRRYKTKAGFSLVELVMVIAVIVILAAVMSINISTYITNAKSKSSEADSLRNSARDNINEREASIVAYGFQPNNASIHAHTTSISPSV